MINILLLCSSGISTSLLVNRMRKIAAQRNLDCNIFTTGYVEYKHYAENADVILLGPQVKYLLREVQKNILNKPIEIIDVNAYGKMNGAAVIDQVVRLLNNTIA